MSAYREGFWLFVGTTGPIIALANVLTFGQATDAQVFLRDEDPQSQPQPGDHLGDKFFRLLRRGHIFFVTLCFLLSVALTMLAAFSLWQRANVLAGSWTIALLIITFALLFVLGACSAALRRREHRIRRGQQRAERAEWLRYTFGELDRLR
jgi:hypothetical protein